MMVFTYSIDVAQFQALQAGRTLYILVDAILIGTYPHAALIVNIDILGGIVRKRCRVKLIVQQLAHFVTLQVHHQHTIMVGSHPQPSAVVHLHIPCLQLHRSIRHVAGLQIFGYRGIPLLVALYIYKGIACRGNPEVTMVVGIDAIVLIALSTVLAHPRTFSHHPTRLSIQADQFTLIGSHGDAVAKVGHTRDTVGGVQLMFSIA